MTELVHRMLKLAFWLTLLSALFGGSVAWPILAGLLLFAWQLPRSLSVTQ